MQQRYATRSTNFVAVNVLKSWARALKLPLAKPTAESVDLMLNGHCVSVRDWTGIRQGIVGIEAKILTGRSLTAASTAFRDLLVACGLPPQEPPIRSGGMQLNQKGGICKTNYKKDEFMSLIRQNEFRRSPDPSPEAWDKYRSVVRSAVDHFLIRRTSNRGELVRKRLYFAGYDRDDLMAIAKLLLVNFCSRYELEDDKFEENPKILYAYIRQRFTNELLPILNKKSLSCSPTRQSMEIALFGARVSGVQYEKYKNAGDEGGHAMPTTGVELTDIPNSEFEDVVLEALDLYRGHEAPEKPVRNCRLDVSTPSARRRSASDLLTRMLETLPHDVLLQELQTVINSRGYYDMQTRREAEQRLTAHQATCSECVTRKTDEKEVVA